MRLVQQPHLADISLVVRTIAALALASTAVYLMRLNDVAGLMVDDAYYVLLGKALAEGDGYRLISSGTTPILPLYPPGLPFLLSLVFRIAPQFPENVWLLKSLSVAAMFAAGCLSYAYFRERRLERDLAALAALAITTIPAFVFLATSTVMSECVYTLTQLGVVYVLQRSARGTSSRSAAVAAGAGLLGAGAVLLRSAGIAVILAGIVWMVKERRWRQAAAFAAASVLCLLPWFLYARAHASSAEARASHGGAVAYSYVEQVRMRWAGAPVSGTITLADVPDRLMTNAVDVFGRAVGGMFAPVMFRGPEESGEEVVSLGGVIGIMRGSMGSAGATVAISLALSAVVLAGFVAAVRRGASVAEFLVPVALAIILIWPFWSFRFLLPLAPFLFFYFVTGLNLLASPRVAHVIVLVLLGLNLFDHARYLLPATGSESAERRPWLAQAREVDDALAWIDGNVSSGIVATTNPALVYLRTGRKTVSFDGSIDDLRLRTGGNVRYIACFVQVQAPSIGVVTIYKTPSRFWIAKMETATD